MKPYDAGKVWRKNTRKFNRGRVRSRIVRTQQHAHRWGYLGQCLHDKCTAIHPALVGVTS